jgi:hypothetical protein
MSKEAMKLALEVLEYDTEPEPKYGISTAIGILKEALAKQEHDLQDTRCECCGYMTYQREHMGCIRAAKQEQGEPVAYVDDEGVIVVCSYKYKAGDKLYTTPQRVMKSPQRKPLTEYEKAELINKHTVWSVTAGRWVLKDFDLIEAVEAAHGIKE